MAEMDYNRDSGFYTVKKAIDKLLPPIILLLASYLYLDLFASSQNMFYGYKSYLQYILLGYFVVDLLVLFMMYEENKKFFRTHWVDILLTVPFLTAFKGLKGLKVVKMSKGTKLVKPTKTLRGVKIGQKTGKLVKKSRKQVKKLFS